MNTSVKIFIGIRSRKSASDVIAYPIFESSPIPNTKVRTSKQREHIKGKSYREGASYFSEEMTEEEVYKLVVNSVGRGWGQRRRDNSIREVVKLDINNWCWD